MPRLIDANELIAYIEKQYCTPCKANGQDYHEIRCRACWVDDMRLEVDGVPTVDAVEVVRCKDCEYEGTASCPTYYEDSMTYRDCWALDGDNDFCSYGERRTDV